ncbi:MAG: cyclic nucleotide-binding domain-containing protein [Verrucomicrobiae bacterium]|nr:cyclic nucleotide-binding domain-containing protein [Verrucomicrobiae bacterium]
MLSAPDIVALLRENETFASAKASVLQQMAAGMEEHEVEAETVLIEQGIRCGSVFLVTEGTFGVYIDDETVPVAELERGRVFGEIGAVSGIEATATVKAITAGQVLEIPGKVLHQAMRDCHALAESLLRSLSRYLGRR